MTIEEGIRLVISFLGGGVVAALFDLLRVSRSERKQRRIQRIQAQILNLYGPLQFFSSQNESYFELNKKFHEAYGAEFTGKQWSPDPTTQKNLDPETAKTLELANTYVRMVTANNDNILAVLRDNYAYIDPDDVEIFRQFTVDYIRMKTERDRSGHLTTPLRIYDHVGEISFMRPEFIETVKRKFYAKKEELESLTS